MPEGTLATDIACLTCGYDLRMIESDRCPECGEPIERDGERVSRIPWMNRVNEGRLIAYWRTVWLVTFSSRRLADEIRRPADLHAAKRFWVITSILVSLPLLVAYVWAWVTIGYIRFVPPSQIAFIGGGATDAEVTAYFDLYLPWALGIHFSPLIAVLIVMTVLSNFGLVTYLYDAKRLGETQRTRAVTIAYYLCGTMAWFPLLTFVGAFAGAVVHYAWGAIDRDNRYTLLATFIPTGIGYASILIYMLRIVSVRATILRHGVVRSMITLLMLPVLWIANTIVWLGLLPWCLGYVWVIVRSW